MSWDYAELSHMAKERGGPERFVNAINYDGVIQGRWQILIPELVFGAIVGLGYGAKQLYEAHRPKKAVIESRQIIEAEASSTVEATAVASEATEEPTPAEVKKARKIIDRIRKRSKNSKSAK